MHRSRTFASGRLSEIFGEKTLDMDKFSLIIGFRKAAQDTWDDPDLLSDQSRKIFEAYSNGINDYLDGVGFFKSDATAYLLPPEFIVLK